jgi:gamma-glutamylcyclotransferase (GGCT)/AIG2-like uncharacterized protein YtfP
MWKIGWKMNCKKETIMKEKKEIKHGLFYGSLRKVEGYNFGRCGKQKYIKTLTLDGYDLYSLGAYPAVVDGKGKVVVELHEIPNAQTAEYIRQMELGAGYEERVVNVDDVDAYLYVYKGNNRLNPELKVEHGDWSKYLAERKK